jgi:hypothetical protein
MDNRIWKDLLYRLDVIESNLTQFGQYIDKTDAFNLASVDIASPLIQLQLQDDDLNNNTHALRGYTKLLNDITNILNELYLNQQREVIQLRNSIHTTYDFIVKNTDYLSIDQNLDMIANQVESNLIGVEEVESSLSSHWNQLPPAADEEQPLTPQHSPHLRYLDRKRKTNALRNKLCRRMENNYSTLQMILDAKVHCQTSINNMIESYAHLLVIEAHNCGVSNALYRANTAIKSQAITIRQNRFLETSEVELDYLSSMIASY